MIKRGISTVLAVIILLSLNISSIAIDAYMEKVEISGDEVIFMQVGDTATLEGIATPVGVNWAYALWKTSSPETVGITNADELKFVENSSLTTTVTALSEGVATVTFYAVLSSFDIDGEYSQYLWYLPHATVTVHVVSPETESRNFSVNSYQYNKKPEQTLSGTVYGRAKNLDLDFSRFEVAPDESMYALCDYNLITCVDLQLKSGAESWSEDGNVAVRLAVPEGDGYKARPNLGQNYRLYRLDGEKDRSNAGRRSQCL